MTAATPNGRWAAKASSLYDERYARAYRAHDDALDGTRAYEQFVQWLRGVCRRFEHDLDVLDLGCGTGRYFWALERARTLVGVDASDAMLGEARTPFRAQDISVGRIDLICGDVMTTEFPHDSFDLVYSIGVLAEHAPLTADLVVRVATWTRTGGRFAFTTVHPGSPSIPRTAQRRLASVLAPALPGAAGQWMRNRLMAGGLYADEQWIEAVLRPHFAVESLTLMESEAHLHCLCVARKVGS